MNSDITSVALIIARNAHLATVNQRANSTITRADFKAKIAGSRSSLLNEFRANAAAAARLLCRSRETMTMTDDSRVGVAR